MAFPSPPATRTRSRKTSADYTATAPTASSSSKGKGKAKQVEFSQDVQIQSLSADEESDLTDLTEIEETLRVPVTPSPRRLRSKGERDDAITQNGKHHAEDDKPELIRRITPMRKAKVHVGSLKESDTEEDEEEEEDQLAEESEMDEEETVEEDDNMATPKAARRTPLRKRLRPRAHLLTPPSDGDDEGSDDESVDITESVAGGEDEDGEEDVAGDPEQEMEDAEEDEETGSEEGTVIEEDEDEAPLSAPRTLRNGKVVGEEMEEDTSDAEQSDVSHDQDAVSVDLDAEGDTEEEEEEVDEAMEEDGKRSIFHRPIFV